MENKKKMKIYKLLLGLILVSSCTLTITLDRHTKLITPQKQQLEIPYSPYLPYYISPSPPKIIMDSLWLTDSIDFIKIKK